MLSQSVVLAVEITPIAYSWLQSSSDTSFFAGSLMGRLAISATILRTAPHSRLYLCQRGNVGFDEWMVCCYVPCVVLAVLHMVPPHNLNLAQIVLVLPLQEVDLLEELLLRERELAHCQGKTQIKPRPRGRRHICILCVPYVRYVLREPTID